MAEEFEEYDELVEDELFFVYRHHVRGVKFEYEAELEDMEERFEEQLQRVEDLVDECDDLRGYSKNLEAELDSWVSLLGQRRELQSIERESMPELQHISLEGCKQVFAMKAFEL